MSMLGMQADELRKTADMAANLDDFERVSIPWMRNKLAPMLREAADTIISLRDRLQDAELGRGACEMHRYKNALGFIDEWQCSECGTDVSGIADDTPPNYCPNCGCEVER